ncbi:hypothetical protein [Psychromicrobium xiongbiense]|uniref:hypothetical protein n=1 Tax=Psychromicrobium xiongbiense TaxID=3051184 RepID=UPI0025550E98|nr:hypothetical protein [Psychromicrobium sp. YIM S02556]
MAVKHQAQRAARAVTTAASVAGIALTAVGGTAIYWTMPQSSASNTTGSSSTTPTIPGGQTNSNSQTSPNTPASPMPVLPGGSGRHGHSSGS